MNYLLDKKAKRKKIKSGIFVAIALLLIFFLRNPIFNILSQGAGTIFKPILSFGVNVSEKISGIGAYFSFKKSLSKENEDLKKELLEIKAGKENYAVLLEENLMLKEIFRRAREEKKTTLAVILAKPDQSIYGTLMVDVGAKQEVEQGDIVFALGDIPIGKVALVNSTSSRVVLFSNPGETTEAEIGGTYFSIVGRGGGNFEVVTPRDFPLEIGQSIILPGITPRILAKVEAIISDDRDSFKKALLVSPVNIQEIKFVQIETHE